MSPNGLHCAYMPQQLLTRLFAQVSYRILL